MNQGSRCSRSVSPTVVGDPHLEILAEFLPCVFSDIHFRGMIPVVEFLIRKSEIVKSVGDMDNQRYEVESYVFQRVCTCLAKSFLGKYVELCRRRIRWLKYA